MVVTLCRSETMTGQTMVIHSGRSVIGAADTRHSGHRDQTVGFDPPGALEREPASPRVIFKPQDDGG
jgi:hypothetical protein